MKHFMKSLIFIFVSILPLEIIGQGSVTNISFYSNSLGMNRNVQVYLPDGYNSQDSIRYPVLYYLHGAWGNHNSHPELITFLNNLIGDSICPLIAVKPDGSVGPWAGSFYTNSDLYGNFEDFIVCDLIQYIDSTYKTIPIKEQRVIMGYSMGGFGSMKLAFKHPDIFCAVASHSGPLDFTHWDLWIPTILQECNTSFPPLSYSPSNGSATHIFFTLAGAFSPNLQNIPYQVDFPLDSMGVKIDSIFNKWLEHSPAQLVSEFTPDSNLAIYFDCGMQDELFMYPFNIGFRDTLNLLGLNYKFLSYNGTHSPPILNRYPFSLSFIDSILNPISNIRYNTANKAYSFILSQNYPNPFNPITNIQFSIPKSEFVTLKIYNLLGQEVATLVSEKLTPGNYKYTWDASGFASGLYYYQFKSNEFQKVKKMIVIK